MGALHSASRIRLRRRFLASLALVVVWPLGLMATLDQSLTGVVAFDHADNFVEQRDEVYPMLETSNGERLELEDVAADQLVAGTRISVRGRRVGSHIYVERGGIRGAGGGSALAATTTTATMDKRVAVLMVNFVAPTPTPSPSPSPTTPPTAPPTDPPPSDSPAPTETPAPPPPRPAST